MSRRLHYIPFLIVLFTLTITIGQQGFTEDRPEVQATGILQASLPSIEALLTQAELPYVKTKAGEYKVVYAEDEASTTVYMKQDGVGKLPEDQVIYFYTMIMKAPSGDITPLLKKIAEYNDSLLVGRVSLNNGNIYYTSSFWLRNADAVTIKEELMVAHFTWQEAEKILEESMKP